MENVNEAPSIDGGFLRTLQTHQGGKTISDMSAAIRNVTAAVREHMKAGKVILTLTIAPAMKGHETAIGFEADVVEKIPRGDAYEGLFFADVQNNLVRENPNQQELPKLRTVATAENETEPLRKTGDV